MKIIFAQGNPGSEFAATRHNVGFYLIDQFAQKHGVSFVAKAKFYAEIGELSSGGEKILLVKPTTYYNETGQSARALVDFYKLTPASDLLVIHDDLALPFGAIRTRLSGSDAGNNGIKSLNAHLGQGYARARIGVYSPLRDQINDVDFVLGKFSQAEGETLPRIAEQTNEFVSQFISGDFVATHVNLAPQD